MNLVKAVTQPLAGSSQALTERDVDWLLVQRVQAGEVAAFDELVIKYRERIYSVVYNLTSNKEDSFDLSQEAFIKAFQSIARFRGKSSFFTWLYRIAVNTTLSFLKKNRHRRFLSYENITEEASSSEVLDVLAAKTSTEKPTLIKELQHKLNEAMQTLSVKHRTVLVLFEIDNLSHQAIADIMNCSVGTVRSRLHYAKKQLQSELQDLLD
ncbi:MAG: sigma-70 family RNA polymerase sigma factor [Verrucomicrobia bacterium]|nr:sigma-70 family RNA polymerase sigma factor [Verrucomicrobiota bacterium]